MNILDDLSLVMLIFLDFWHNNGNILSIKIFDMKHIYFSLIFISLSIVTFSQTMRVDYDNASKWFLGFNAGGTWHSTDVKNQVGGAWGLTLGKTYNYNYGRPLTFDIRGRYLTGNWYGQDTDSSALSGLSSDAALYDYQSSPGYTYHNFKSNIHRLSLELAIHLNAITQRTGWDPYVFGGVGFTWNQSKGNLTDSSEISSGADPYSYGTTSLGGINFDDSYETNLDGYSKYQVNFMPSLGFGLGYHIGKRTTFGIEHKTTFTLADEFDAVQTDFRPKQDLYHYTSLYLQFRFRGRVNGDYGGNSNSGGNTNGFTSNCPDPVVTIATSSNLTVTNPQFDIDFRATEIVSQNAIQVLNGNNVPVFFNFNTSTKKGSVSVTLSPGVNTFTIIARNRCGTDSKTFSVIFNNCSLPAGTYTNPNPPGSVVRSQSYVLGAIVSGVQSKSSIRIFANGTSLNNFSYNSQNGVIQANVSLNVGVNNFRIELNNACGNATLESLVTYDNCTVPTAIFLNPSATGTTISSQNIEFRANVTGVTTNQQVNLDINGLAVRNFSISNGVLTANLSLSVGQNTITLRVNNVCGSDTKVTTINYQTCKSPIITVTSPSNNKKVTTSALRLQAKIENIQAKNNLKIQLNGTDITNYSFKTINNGTKSADTYLTLTAGLNIITISANNNCGTDVETITVDYDNCLAPTVDITSSGSETTNNSYELSASIGNMANAVGITVSRNDQEIGFNFASGQLFSAVSLLPGVNTFLIKANKSCGSASKTITVNYQDCQAPTVSLVQPSAGITVNSSQYLYTANVANVNASNQVIVTLNNQVVNPTLVSGVVSGNLNLLEGLNTLYIKVSNTCGMDVKTVTITRVSCTPPVVSIINPSQNATVIRPGLAFEATLLNAASYTMTLNGQAVSASRNGNLLSVNLSLIPGANIISLSGVNACGNDTETATIFYNNCVAPVITMNTSGANQTVSSSVYNFSATLTNSSQSSIAFTLNGMQSPFSFSSNILSASLVLNEGMNVIVISTTNACGADTKTLSINYQAPINNNGSSGNGGSSSGAASDSSSTGNGNGGSSSGNGSGSNGSGNGNDNNCLAPTIFVPDFRGGAVTSNPQFSFTGSVSGYSFNGAINIIFNTNQIPVTVNSNGSFTVSVVLNTGINVFMISATNDCGTDTKSFDVELVAGNLQNNNGGGNNQGSGQKSSQSGEKNTNNSQVKPTTNVKETQQTKSPNGNAEKGTQTNKPTVKPTVTNKPGQTESKPKPSGGKEEKPKQNTPTEVKPKVGPKVNGTNKGGGK